MAEITRPHVTVVLTGDGGDETFVGYDRYRLANLAGWFRLPGPMLHGLYSVSGPFARFIGRGERILRARPKGIGDAYLATLFQPPVGLHLGQDGSSPEERFSRATRELRGYFSNGTQSTLNSMLALDVHSYLPDDLLVKVDVATMAHSLEARSPLLDHKLMELMASIPASRKLGRRRGKRLLRQAMSGILPPEILNRSKKGFGVPLASWLRNDLSELMRETLLSDDSQSKRYFDPGKLARIVNQTLA